MPPDIIQRVRILVEASTQGLKDFGKGLAMPLEELQKINKIAGMTTNQFQKFAKSVDPEFLDDFNLKLGKNNQFVQTGRKGFLSMAEGQKVMTDSISKGGGKLANSFRLGTHGLHGFRMEMLGVMFFGMGFQKFLTGLLEPAAKLVGLFDIFGTILEVLFLPVMLALLDPLLWVMDFIMNLPEGVKIAIGFFVLFSAIIFGLIFALGMLALGIGSIILVFGPLLAGLGALIAGAEIGTGGAINLAIVPILALIAGGALALVTVLTTLATLWTTNTGGIQDFVFGLIATFDEIMKLIGEGDLAGAISKILTVVQDALNFVIGWIIGTAVPAIATALAPLVDTVLGLIDGLMEAIGLGDYWNAVKGAFFKLFDNIILFLKGEGDVDVISLILDAFGVIMTAIGLGDYWENIRPAIETLRDSLYNFLTGKATFVDLAISAMHLVMTALGLEDYWNDIEPAVRKIMQGLYDFITAAEQIRSLEDAFKVIIKAIDWFDLGINAGIEFLKGMAETILGGIGVVTEGYRRIFGFLTGQPGYSIKGFANGGLITKPTLALLGESGPEMITPLGGGGISNTVGETNITINANVSSGANINDLADQIDRVLSARYRTLGLR